MEVRLRSRLVELIFTSAYQWYPYDPSYYKLLNDASPVVPGSLYNYADPAVLLPLRIQSDNDEPNPRDVAVLTFTGNTVQIIHPMTTNPTWQGIVGRSREVYPGKTFVPLADKYRSHGNAVLMPNGSVMLVGGVDTPWRQEGHDIQQEEERFVQEAEYILPAPNKPEPMWDWKVAETSQKEAGLEESS